MSFPLSSSKQTRKVKNEFSHFSSHFHNPNTLHLLDSSDVVYMVVSFHICTSNPMWSMIVYMLYSLLQLVTIIGPPLECLTWMHGKINVDWGYL